MRTITVTVSGPPKVGKTIVGNLIAEVLEMQGLEPSKRNFEDKYLSEEDTFALLGNVHIKIVEHTERADRPEMEN